MLVCEMSGRLRQIGWYRRSFITFVPFVDKSFFIFKIKKKG